MTEMMVRLNGSEALNLQSYEISNDMFAVNSSQFTLGAPGSFKEFLASFPLGTGYENFFGQAKLQSGTVLSVSRVSGENVISMQGSDVLDEFFRFEIEKEQSLQEYTYKRLVEKALEECGVKGVPIYTSGKAAREAIVGPVQTTEKTVKGNASPIAPGDRLIPGKIKLSVGETWMDVISTQLRRIGLFIWTSPIGGPRGSIVISQPDTQQEPVYALLRIAGDQNTNILSDSFSNSIQNRFSEYKVYGRNSGGKDGIGKVTATVTDTEMVACLNQKSGDIDSNGKPSKRRVSAMRDKSVTSEFQAKCLCQRRMCDARRESFSMSYTIQGHSLPNAAGDPVLVIPDTMIWIDDDELGISGQMYVKSVTYSGNEQSTYSQIGLWRVEDIWLEPEEPRPKRKAATKAAPDKTIHYLPTYEGDPATIANNRKALVVDARFSTLGLPDDSFLFIDRANYADGTYENPERDNAEQRAMLKRNAENRKRQLDAEQRARSRN